MTSIPWAGLRCVQELWTILGPQNRTQRSCAMQCLYNSKFNQSIKNVVAIKVNCPYIWKSTHNISFLFLWSSGKGQARICKGWPWKGPLFHTYSIQPKCSRCPPLRSPATPAILATAWCDPTLLPGAGQPGCGPTSGKQQYYCQPSHLLKTQSKPHTWLQKT